MIGQLPPELVELFQILVDHFSLEELKTLCFKLRFDYDDLPGESRVDKAREMVRRLNRRNRIGELVRLLIQELNHPSVGIIAAVSEEYAAARRMVDGGQDYSLGARQDGVTMWARYQALTARSIL